MQSIKVRPQWSRVRPESNMTGALVRDEKTDIHSKNSYLMRQTEAGVMAVTNQGTPRFACNHQKLTEARKNAPLSDSEGS